MLYFQSLFIMQHVSNNKSIHYVKHTSIVIVKLIVRKYNSAFDGGVAFQSLSWI